MSPEVFMEVSTVVDEAKEVSLCLLLLGALHKDGRRESLSRDSSIMEVRRSKCRWMVLPMEVVMASGELLLMLGVGADGGGTSCLLASFEERLDDLDDTDGASGRVVLLVM